MFEELEALSFCLRPSHDRYAFLIPIARWTTRLAPPPLFEYMVQDNGGEDKEIALEMSDIRN